MRLTSCRNRVTVQVQNNPKATAQQYLIMNVGMNIQIDRIKKLSKDNYRILLRAVLPYRLTLENGDIHVGYVKFNNMGSFRVTKIKGMWKIDKASLPSNHFIDKLLVRKTQDYKKLLNVKELMWV